ncbi:MAG: hypothetical protein K2V38_09625 [Gemmataceae bacterium]|nr:hypothetical protein [Gemmataceae bacterium]
MRWNFNLILLAGVADVWRRLRQEFKFGSRAPRETIEAEWDTLLARIDQWAREQGQPRSPFRELRTDMLGDPTLLADLRRVWRDCVAARRGYEFEEVLEAVFALLFYRSLRCAHQYLLLTPHPVSGWARRWWYPYALRRELEEAVDAQFRFDRVSMDVQESQNLTNYDPLRLLSTNAVHPGQGEGPAIDVARDERRVDDTGPDDSADLAAFLETVRGFLSADDYALFVAYVRDDERSLEAIARDHGRSREYLLNLMHHVAALLRRQPPTGGQK